MKKFSRALAFSMLVFLMLGAFNTEAKVVSEDLQTKVPFPSLKIEKWINASERIEPDQVVTVHVNITNVGLKTAYNLSVSEPSFENFSVLNVNGYDGRNWVEMAPNATYSYDFSMKFVKEGIYTIERTTITYQDAADMSYTAYSGFFKLDVTKVEVPVSTLDQWKSMAVWLLLILVIPGVLYLINKYAFEGRK